MPLQNDPRIYSGGGVVLDSRPHVQLYAQLKQREQAKQDALDEYIRNLNKNVNPSGMRNQEREVFEDKLKRWQEFGMANKDNLRNPRKDNGAASMEFQAGYQDLQNTIAESKGREEGKKPIIPSLLNPEDRDRMDESFMNELSAHDAPIWRKNKLGQWERNPDSRPVDFTKTNFNPKPFDQDKYFKSFDDIKKSDLPPTIVKDPKNMTQTVTTTSVFDPEAKDLVATRATGTLFADKGFKKLIKELPPEDYNDFFKEHFGRDIQNEGDLAAAYTLKGLQQKTVKSELKDDLFAQRKELASLNDMYARRRMKMRMAWQKAAQDGDDNNALNRFIQMQYDNGGSVTKDGKSYNAITIDGKVYNGRFVDVPKTIKKNNSQEFNDKDGKKFKQEPDEWFMTEDKTKIIPMYYEGQTKSGTPKLTPGSKPIDILSYKTELRPILLSLKDGSGAVLEEFPDEDFEDEIVPASGGNVNKKTYPLPSGKPREIKQGGFTYVWDESTGNYK